MERLIHILGSSDAALPLVGCKGTSLNELARTGFPVLPGFVITTPAYHAFLRANDLQERVERLCRSAAAEDLPALETTSHLIRNLFHEGAIPAEIADAVGQAYRELCRMIGSDTAVAVRSSATAEDLSHASFAGQQETFLNVRGQEDLLDKIKQCWSSLWTARAMAYRAGQGIRPTSVSLAVIVEQMALADAAGVAFTANPVSAARDEIVINAVRGLGESLVSGLVTPDNLVADKVIG
jgi:rifampicin phosphotransferase